MVVVDANVLLGHLQGRPVAVELQNVDPEWIVPTLWRYEVANGANGMRRAGLFDSAQAETLMLVADESYTKSEEAVSAAEVLRFAQRHGLSGYDASYVALADRLNLKLLTWDKEILKKLPDMALTPEKFIEGFY